MSYKDIIGYAEEIAALKTAIEKGAVSSAYIFYGPEGIGKRLAALNFAKALNCLGENDTPCEKCLPCRKINDFNFPDLFTLKGSGKSNSIKIDEKAA